MQVHTDFRLRIRRRAKGYVLVKTMALIIIGLMASFLAIDMGLYFTAQNQLQTASDAGALSGVGRLYKGPLNETAGEKQYAAIDSAIDIAQSNLWFSSILEEDITLGYIDRDIGYDEATFEIPAGGTDYAFSGGFNAMRVRSWSDASHDGFIPTVIGNVFQVNQMDSRAQSVALMDDQVVSFTGLRPIYACHNQFLLAGQDGNISNDTVRVYNDRFMLNGDITTCPTPPSGNWGFADFRDGAPGAPGVSELTSWWANGYPGEVSVDEFSSTQTGNSIHSVKSELAQLKANETVIVIPLVDSFTGGGSNSKVEIRSFTGFVITGFKDTGPEDSRYIEGYFTRAICNHNCKVDGNLAGGGIAKLRLVSN